VNQSGLSIARCVKSNERKRRRKDNARTDLFCARKSIDLKCQSANRRTVSYSTQQTRLKRANGPASELRAHVAEKKKEMGRGRQSERERKRERERERGRDNSRRRISSKERELREVRERNARSHAVTD